MGRVCSCHLLTSSLLASSAYVILLASSACPLLSSVWWRSSIVPRHPSSFSKIVKMEIGKMRRRRRRQRKKWKDCSAASPHTLLCSALICSVLWCSVLLCFVLFHCSLPTLIKPARSNTTPQNPAPKRWEMKNLHRRRREMKNWHRRRELLIYVQKACDTLHHTMRALTPPQRRCGCVPYTGTHKNPYGARFNSPEPPQDVYSKLQSPGSPSPPLHPKKTR
eukprot:gene9565-biopygen9267